MELVGQRHLEQHQEEIGWGLKDQFSPAGAWVVSLLAHVDFGLPASPKVGQVSCAPEHHGSYSSFRLP